jgi:RNA polymerase sigma factor (sigma-70 family)
VPTESLLAEFSATGQQPMFEEIVRRYAGMVFAVCLRTCRDAHDAEDATQAVFLALAVQCKSGNPVRHLPAWLRQVAKRTSLDVRKSRKRREAREAKRRAENNGIVHDQHNGDGKANGDALDLEKVGHVLSEELAKLPTKYRLPLVSLYFGGLSREEIAEQLGLKPGALGVRLHRARQMLGERLKRRGAVSDGIVLSMGIMPFLDNAFGHALTLRTTEAAAHVMLGHSLSGHVSAGVLATMNGTFGAVSIGRMKVVASALLVLVGSVAAGGTALADSSDIVPQVLTHVWQWMERVRSGVALPSLRLELLSDAGTHEPLDFSEPDSRDGLLAQRPYPVQLPDLPPPAQAPPPTDPIAHAVPPPTLTPDTARPKSLADIEYPQIARATAPRSSALPRPKPFERDSLKADPQATALASDPRRLAAGGGGTNDPAAGGPREVMLTNEPSAPPPLAGSGAGNVVTMVGPSVGSDHLAIASGAPRGRHVAGGRLTVASDAGTNGTYRLETGTLSVGIVDIGSHGNGSFVQTGGRTSTTQILLGDGEGGHGSFAQAGGEIVLSGGADGVPAGIVVGGDGAGTLLLGNGDRPGYIFSADIPPGAALATVSPATPTRSPLFLVRATQGGYGLVRGWGRVVLPDGTLVNNGQVVADGFGRDSALTFSGFGSITNTIDNQPGEANGWYAVNGGQLTMSASFNPAGSSFTWGENLADPTIDLVNSVRLVLQPPPQQLSVSLLATDRTDLPTLPGGHSFLGVWSVDTFGQADVEGIDLTVRYDDLLAGTLGLNQSSLKLWYFRDGLWSRVTGEDFWLDSANHLIGGHVDGSIDYFAVSAPEPGSVVTIALAGATLLLRRRARGR